MRTLVLSAVLAPAVPRGIIAQDFVNRAASGGLFEVRSSELALQLSQDDGIRAFAETMIRDPTANNGDLLAMATNPGLLIPDELTEPHAGMMAAIEGAGDDAFDAACAEGRVAAHEAAVALYGDYAEGGDNDLLIG